MIDLELKTALFLYSTLLGGIIFAIWLYTEISIRLPQRFLGRQFLWKCSICGFSYLDEEGEALSKCPQCGSLNTAEESDRPVPHHGIAGISDTSDESIARRNPSRRKRPNQRKRGPKRH